MSGIDKDGFFETKCPFGTYRESILRFFQNENSKTIKYYLSYWVGGRDSVSYNTAVPRRQILMIRKILDDMTSIKLVYDYDYLDKYFKKCLKGNKRFIVMHLGLPQHANCLIYDTKLKELERYDPVGAGAVDIGITNIIDRHLKQAFITGENPIIGKDVKYISPLDYCPVGLQEQKNKTGRGDPGGFCHWWTLYYMDLRLSNPDVPRSTLLRRATSAMETLMTNKWVEDEIEKKVGKVNLDVEFDFNKFMRTYGAYLIIAESYLINIIEDNTKDDYGILMTKAMEHFIRNVL